MDIVDHQEEQFENDMEIIGNMLKNVAREKGLLLRDAPVNPSFRHTFLLSGGFYIYIIKHIVRSADEVEDYNIIYNGGYYKKAYNIQEVYDICAHIIRYTMGAPPAMTF